ncbi:hypothetical protein CO151_12580 [bacterium CG_4_9_14_3_um_filter_65_15]|nr:MAG: hypothetical protein CO151_12580 [bacterium CG_4_9_14_3_um_filter_65_15]
MQSGRIHEYSIQVRVWYLLPPDMNPDQEIEMRHFRPSRPALLLTTTLLILLALPALAAPEMVTTDGVLHIRNGAEPTGGVQDMDLEEMWRIGGEDDEDVLLGIITRARIADKGDIYLLDAQLSQAQVFSPDGEFIKTLGRQGSGPGELTAPGDMVFMPDGTLGLVQIFPGKIVKLDLDGTPAGDFNPEVGTSTSGGFLALVSCRSAGGNLALAGIQISMDTSTMTQVRTYFLRSFAIDGQQTASYIERPVTWKFDSNFKFREIDNDFIWWRMDVGPDGKVVSCIPRYGYALSVWNPDGTLDRVIERQYEPWTRTDKVKQRFQSIMEAQAAQFPPGTPVEVEDQEQDIEDLRVDKDGNIWVLPSREMFEPQEGFFATYDVFSPDGQFTRQVRVKCEGDPSVDRLLFAGDRVFVVTGFWDAVLQANSAPDEDVEEAEPMSVICYKVK